MAGVKVAEDTVRENLRAAYGRATPDQRERGRLWYLRAFSFAAAWGHSAGVGTAAAASVIAALSPNVGWEQNLRLAREFLLQGRRDGTFGASCRKAARIIDGEDPGTVLGGDKVRSFAANIAGDLSAVTLDRHMYRAIGWPIGTATTRQYRALSDIVREEATAVNLTPAQYQATVWLVQREG